jgi:prevent-host-death family protein
MSSPKAKTARQVLRIVPALTARTQLGQILKRVRQNKERFVVDRRGVPQAVIMSVEEYLGNFTRPIPVLEEVRQAARAKGLDSLTMRAINQEIKRYRRERRKKND